MSSRAARFLRRTFGPLLADFTRAEREARDFETYSRLRAVAFTRAILALSIVGDVAWAWTDPFVFNAPGLLASIVKLRISFVVMFALAWLYLGVGGEAVRRHPWRRIVPLQLAATAFGAAWLGTLARPEMPLGAPLWIVVVGTVVFPLPPVRRMLLNIAVIAVGMGTYLVFRGGPLVPSDLMTVLFGMFAGFCSTVLGHLVYRLELAGFDQRREIEEHARRSDELSRLKDAFVATVSHELRTPLHAIIGLTDSALDHELGPELRGQLGTVRDCGEVLLELVNDILELQQIRAGGVVLERAPVELRGLVEGAAAIVSSTCAEKGLALSHRVDPELPPIAGDSRRIGQILRNLTANAVKFTDAGEVQVSAGRVEADGRGWVEVEVRDTGPGIPADARERIFEEFVRVEPANGARKGGTGLGLSIARRLAETMGGSLRVAENVPRGSVFALRLPLEPAGPVPVAEPAGGLWLVHARPALRLRNAVETLGLLGIEVRVAHGPESLATLLRTTADVRAVLVDDAFLSPEKLRDLRLVDACGKAGVPLVLALDPRRMARAGAAGLETTRRIPAPARLADLREVLRARPAPERKPEPPVERRRRRVLVVDDVRENRVVASAYLRGTAYEVELAESGADALSRLERGTFDAVLLDIEMPRMDGFAVLKSLRARERAQGLPPTPVFAMTAHGATELQGRDPEADFAAHLVKPVRRTALLAALDAVTGTTSEAGPEPVLPEALATTFLQQATDDLAALQQTPALALDPCRALGHRLAGAAATFGFEALGRLGRELELAAKRGDAGETQRLVQELSQATERLRAA